ncbi:MAG: CHAP domain-containing protein [Bifidobacterium tibiigranuli]|jgi:surface antigen|uniref:CHAP domain-containing protein n=1 Tax=Bifidobacterium tibiigranuli TaxID=2172043 RepID=UPI002352B122|nr:CHAP domain-containing protein [Bifidobacterium tibiigranuli]MCH3973973.1 CHAP domain-containing protein [Bifidobacterium tibiigranuli]MCH4189813.1 CHAP domain-containing protein [Bifidobacterium tibiigranuli]MCH4203963.1 CHAP domain-containing protein [Bifidobacterium tibiigranuli]MCH4274530.1 CHAP domain-containing protein [Bifidobacterium tibiigranuli]MCI1790859.1 CHAP domain-containing protein [Bifidobacterium tibiigranuli]
MTHAKRINAAVGIALAAASIFAAGTMGTMIAVPQAQAAPDWNAYQNKVQDQENLKQQLAGVNQNLADQILSLNDLTENQIPQAQQAADSAQQQADQAQSLAQATSERLDAAKKDQGDLEAKIKQTGADYDDAKEAVAQLARDSFHGSSASQVMDVVTKSKTTDQFVNSMQSDAAITRSEANAADSAATTLNTSKNRKERLNAIAQQISDLKQQADAQAAYAQSAAQSAQDKQTQLQALREQGNQARASLEEQKSGLTSKAAQEAADIVTLKSQIDSYNEQMAAQAAAAPDPGNGGQQQTTGGGNAGGGSGGGGYTPAPAPIQPAPAPAPAPNNGGGGANGMNYGVPGNCPSGSSFCYGHYTGNTAGGSAYPSRQCTLWAYLRRSELGLPVGSYMGNGGQWAATARGMGYLVNNTPHVGAAMVFAPGQSVGGHWTADWQYGHVAVVERVNSDGSVLISEGGTGFASFPAYETISDSWNYQYVHY